MATGDLPEKVTPAYIPFPTLTHFIERLKSTAIPEQIDNSLLMPMSGGMRGSVRSALRFLGLTDANDFVNTTFHDLIQAHGGESWPQVLGSVIDTAYAPVLNGLDVTRATPNQLNGRFKAVPVTLGRRCTPTLRRE